MRVLLLLALVVGTYAISHRVYRARHGRPLSDMEKAAYAVRQPENIKIQVQCGGIDQTPVDVERHFKGVDQDWVEDVCNQYCPEDAQLNKASQSIAQAAAAQKTAASNSVQGVAGLNDSPAEKNPYQAKARWNAQNRFCVILPVEGDSWTMKEMQRIADEANDEHQRRREYARRPKKVRGVKLQCGALQDLDAGTDGGKFIGDVFAWLDDEDGYGYKHLDSQTHYAASIGGTLAGKEWKKTNWAPPVEIGSKTCGNENVHCGDSYEPRPLTTKCQDCKKNGSECCQPYLDASATQQAFVDQACLKYCDAGHFCNVLQTYDDFIAWVLDNPDDAVDVLAHEGVDWEDNKETRENDAVNIQSGADHYADSVQRRHLPHMP